MTSRSRVSQHRRAAAGPTASRRSGMKPIDRANDNSNLADKSRLDAIVESSSDAIISVTRDSIIDSWNLGAARSKWRQDVRP